MEQLGLFGHGFDTVIISLQEADTDFIFSVITGFSIALGAITLLIAILALDVCILYVGLKATHQSDKYSLAGIFGCMIFQQFWNIAMIFQELLLYFSSATHSSSIWWVFTFILHDCNWNVF